MEGGAAGQRVTDASSGRGSRGVGTASVAGDTLSRLASLSLLPHPFCVYLIHKKGDSLLILILTSFFICTNKVLFRLLSCCYIF